MILLFYDLFGIKANYDNDIVVVFFLVRLGRFKSPNQQ
jgi:hypothetical protein